MFASGFWCNNSNMYFLQPGTIFKVSKCAVQCIAAKNTHSKVQLSMQCSALQWVQGSAMHCRAMYNTKERCSSVKFSAAELYARMLSGQCRHLRLGALYSL